MIFLYNSYEVSGRKNINQMFKVCYAWSWPETDWDIVSFGDRSWEEDSSGSFSTDFLLLCVLLWFVLVFFFFPPSDYQFIVSAALQLINTPALPLPHTGRILLALRHTGGICKVKNIYFYYLSLYHWFVKQLYLQVT